MEIETILKKKTRKDVIRIGDIVQIVKPEMFVRCGYPLTIKEIKDSFYNNNDYVKDERYAKIIELFRSITESRSTTKNYVIEETPPFSRKSIAKVIDALAYEILRCKGFGGKERTMHTLYKPELEGAIYKVCRKKTCVTGEYFPPWSSHDYWTGEYDCQSGGLDKAKVHLILYLDYVSNADVPKIRAEVKEEEREKINANVFHLQDCTENCDWRIAWDSGLGIRIEAQHVKKIS